MGEVGDEARAVGRWAWPGKARAAISLSYDDGFVSQLRRAVPELEARGLSGTFYLATRARRTRRRLGEWQAVFARGHEIGSHSARHPCRADAFAAKAPRWLPEDKWLEHYTPEAIEREIADAADWLAKSIGVDADRTYAYPCYATSIGVPPDEGSYRAAVKAHHSAARVGGDAPNDPLTVDLLKIRSYAAERSTLEELMRWCDAALCAGHWTVLTFHGVGGCRLKIGKRVHSALLDYLVGKDYWVAPVRDVARYIRETRRVPGRQSGGAGLRVRHGRNARRVYLRRRRSRAQVGSVAASWHSDPIGLFATESN